tara:strand:+ start:366 stop:515 length:150 start_codon:yes stop_codon:yes gene_type:complete
MLDRAEYEERYGEAVIYCRIHKRTDIDYCIVCEEDERLMESFEEEDNDE